MTDTIFCLDFQYKQIVINIDEMNIRFSYYVLSAFMLCLRNVLLTPIFRAWNLARSQSAEYSQQSHSYTNLSLLLAEQIELVWQHLCVGDQPALLVHLMRIFIQLMKN